MFLLGVLKHTWTFDFLLWFMGVLGTFWVGGRQSGPWTIVESSGLGMDRHSLITGGLLGENGERHGGKWKDMERDTRKGQAAQGKHVQSTVVDSVVSLRCPLISESGVQ